jgi:hypothetical protein
VNTVGPNTFRGLPLLQSLRLQGNDISEFAEGQFFDLPNIHELDIRSNNDSLAPSCCDLCGVSPSALQMHYSNNTVLHKDDSGIYSLRCGTRLNFNIIYKIIAIIKFSNACKIGCDGSLTCPDANLPNTASCFDQCNVYVISAAGLAFSRLLRLISFAGTLTLSYLLYM